MRNIVLLSAATNFGLCPPEVSSVPGCAKGAVISMKRQRSGLKRPQDSVMGSAKQPGP